MSAPTLSERLVALAARHRKAERDMRDRQQNSLAAFEADAAEVMEEAAAEIERLQEIGRAVDAAEELHHHAKYVRTCLRQGASPKVERVAMFEAAILEYAKASCKQPPPVRFSEMARGENLGCPDVERMGQFACSDRSRCWEPCGSLGHDPKFAIRTSQLEAAGLAKPAP